MHRNVAQWAGWTIVPVLLLVVWQWAAVAADKPWLFPTVTQVLDELLHPLRTHYASGSLWSNTLVSLLRVAIGFALAATVGVFMGVALGSIKWLRWLVEPTLEIIRPLSPIAWLPFAIAVFKLNTIGSLFGHPYTRTILDQVQLGMLVVIFVGGFFPILINTIDGVTGVRRNYVLLAHSLGARRPQIFAHVHLPAALPMILTGLRLGLARCWMVIIAAEMMTGSDSGIGYLLVYAADNSAMDVVVAAMVIIGGMGALFGYGMRLLMSRFVRWQGMET